MTVTYKIKLMITRFDIAAHNKAWSGALPPEDREACRRKYARSRAALEKAIEAEINAVHSVYRTEETLKLVAAEATEKETV